MPASGRCALSDEPDAWVEASLADAMGGYDAIATAAGQRGFVEWYADEVMVQRDLTPDEMAWIVGQSANSPPFVAQALWASGFFSDYMAEATALDAAVPQLYVLAEHWSDTAVPWLAKHFPNTKSAVLGGHMMFWEYPEQFNQILDDFLAGAGIQ